MSNNTTKDLQPYSPSVQDFCRFLEQRGKQATSPKSLAELWESQAEALRISRKDASVETIDMLLDTMLATLHHLADAEEEQHWTNRMKAFWRVRSEPTTQQPSEHREKLLYTSTLSTFE